MEIFKVTAWNNGRHHSSGAGYGVRISLRDRYFFVHREAIYLKLTGIGNPKIPISKSFKHSCPELRHKEIGRWLMENYRPIPWEKGHPPQIDMIPLNGNYFRLRPIR